MGRALLSILIALGAWEARAQSAPPAAPPEPAPANAAPVALDEADVAVVFTVRADRVRFDGPPEASLRLYAEPGGQVEAKYEPGLLPRIISPTVTYSNVELSYVGAALLAASEAPAPAAPESPATPR